MDFSKWEGVHGAPDQEKRLKSAKSSACTPLSISAEDFSGIFSGSHGTYQTTLETCTCVDFSRRKKPCKHMYRLAAELGIFEVGGFTSDSSKIKRPAPTSSDRRAAFVSAIEKIEGYAIDVQDELREVLRMAYKKELFLCSHIDRFERPIADGLLEVLKDYEKVLRSNTQKSTLEALEARMFKFPDGLKNTKKARFEWCLENADEVGTLIYPSVAFLRPAGVLDIAQRKVYTYLLRKFTDDEAFDENGHIVKIPHGAEYSVKISIAGGVSELSISFPDDEVTDMLDRYGANRCRGWKS